jgi:Family of unknown function (DUF6812)
MAGGWDISATGFDMFHETGANAQIELVGMHLRVRGTIDIGRFQRLSDRVNHSRGYIRIEDARLLKRNGDPTPLVVDVLFVNQDEVTFIALAHTSDEVIVADPSQADRPLIVKVPRRFLVFTPGHVISGTAHVYSEMTTERFADTTDPRFIPMTDASVRSLADRRIVSHFDLLLVNRTQMTAVAEPEQGSAPVAPVVES